MPKFEIKSALFGHFGLGFNKTIVIFKIKVLKFVWVQNLFEINTLKFVIKWVFNSHSDFWYRIFGIRVSQTSGVRFSSRSGNLGSVPLYKVCQLRLTRGITRYACICPRKMFLWGYFTINCLLWQNHAFWLH